jgi:hypothetical protein
MTFGGPNSPGRTAPPIRPVAPEHQAATRGDIAAVINALDEIRRLLEDIRGLMQKPQNTGS